MILRMSRGTRNYISFYLNCHGINHQVSTVRGDWFSEIYFCVNSDTEFTIDCMKED